MNKSRDIVEFGDFQTPLILTKQVAIIAINSVSNIRTIIEPTCGLGTFLKALIEIETEFSNKNSIETSIKNIIGWEINPKYVEIAKNNLSVNSKDFLISVQEQDFFQVNWSEINHQLQHPVLFIGNPPWVTNSE